MKVKKLILLAAVIGALLVPSGVFAGTSNIYTFTLGNTGTTFTHYTSNTDTKAVESDPWTINVDTISTSGSYGIRFAPAKCDDSNSVTSVCTQSGRWLTVTGWTTTAYASGDNVVKQKYKLAARQDDSYYSYFYSSGWYDADYVKP